MMQVTEKGLALTGVDQAKEVIEEVVTLLSVFINLLTMFHPLSFVLSFSNTWLDFQCALQAHASSCRASQSRMIWLVCSGISRCIQWLQSSVTTSTLGTNCSRSGALATMSRSP